MSFFALKLVALLSMLWDHVTSVWPVSWWIEDLFFQTATQTPQIALTIQHVTDYLGRIAAPIFLFSIANGYRHTHSLTKYALRLFVFACLAEYPYFLLFQIRGNILFTLLIGLLMLEAFERGNRRRPGLGWALAGAMIVLMEAAALFEGKGRYLLFILVFYLTERWTVGKKTALWLVLLPLARYALTWNVLLQAAGGTLDPRWLHMWAVNAVGPFLGVALTFFYHGKRGPTFPGDKYLWYAFYPAHLLILGLLAPH